MLFRKPIEEVEVLDEAFQEEEFVLEDGCLVKQEGNADDDDTKKGNE